MSLTNNDREMLISWLNQLGGKRLNDVGTMGRTIHTFLTQRGVKWDDLLIPCIEAKDLLVNEENELQILEECEKQIGFHTLTNWEENFVASNIERMSSHGYLSFKQRSRLNDIVKRLQRLGIWRVETVEMAK